jgi:hypothetical protein
VLCLLAGWASFIVTSASDRPVSKSPMIQSIPFSVIQFTLIHDQDWAHLTLLKVEQVIDASIMFIFAY